MCQSAWRRRTVVALRFRNGLFLIGATFLLTCTCWAQLPQAGDTTSPPTPGVGHDYIHSPVETVNPANGSVSIRIPVRIASGRELTIPFSIAYDSSGAFYIGEPEHGGAPSYLTIGQTSTPPPFTKGGWSYTFPQTTSKLMTWTAQDPSGSKTFNCDELVNYVFQDSTGNRHNLRVALFDDIVSWAPYCGGDNTALTGGEGPILAASSGWGHPFVVTDGNGTVYLTGPSGSTITDRNGNTVSVSMTSTSASMSDTLGRTIVSAPSFGANPDNISVAGLASPYQVSWTTASANFTDSMIDLNAGGFLDGGCATAMTGSATVASQVVLPNGQKYQFFYDPTYGMLQKIIYPSGGYVRYVWGLSLYPEALSYGVNDSNGVTATTYTCRYGFPAISDRYVSFDGSTEVLHQHFSYNTTWPNNTSLTWTSKATTVTTSDIVRGTSFTTVYTYSSASVPCQPDLNPNGTGCIGNFTEQVPVEQTIQYQGTNGSVLKTVTKSWANNDPR